MPYGKLVIVPVSDWLRREMSESFLKDCRFDVIHNGIDTEVFKMVDDAAVREKYGLGSRHIILGVASIWSREKGFDDFMRLASMLSDDEVLVLVGMDDERIMSLPDNVVGITRTDDVHELAALYSAADVFVNPTWQDNYPTVNLESISCGTPVVTYDTGGSPESVAPDTGYVVSPGDLASALAAVRRIEAAGKEHYRPLCRAYAEDNFRKEDRYKDYIGLYEDLLKRDE